MNDVLITIIGIAGAGFALVAFVMNQTDRWKNSDFIYDVFNVVASVLLVAYALLLGSIPFLILNFVWGAYSLRDVVGKLRGKS